MADNPDRDFDSFVQGSPAISAFGQLSERELQIALVCFQGGLDVQKRIKLIPAPVCRDVRSIWDNARSDEQQKDRVHNTIDRSRGGHRFIQSRYIDRKIVSSSHPTHCRQCGYRIALGEPALSFRYSANKSIFTMTAFIHIHDCGKPPRHHTRHEDR